MTVKELIEQLEELDQQKNIWILYDGCYPIVPDDVYTFDKDHADEFDDDDDVNEGDYYFKAY